MGVDNNKNGIRDDIEKYIDTIEEMATKSFDMDVVASNCLDKYYDNESQSWSIQKAIQAYTFNTKKRLEIYLQLDDTASGMSFEAPEEDCNESFFKK